MSLLAVLFDVDFTLARPGPELGPEGYRRLGERFGLSLDPSRYGEAREQAVEQLRRHPELDHDEEVWVVFTEAIVRGMGGDSERAREAAEEMTRAWEHAHNFELYDDVLPTLAALREHTPEARPRLEHRARPRRVRRAPPARRRRAALVRRPRQDEAAPDDLPRRARAPGVEPEEAVMVGDSIDDDVEGAQALGMRAILLDREGRHPGSSPGSTSARLPAALGLSRSSGGEPCTIVASCPTG